MERLRKYLSERHGLSGELCDLIITHHKLTVLTKNDFFISQGKVNRHSGFLLDGILRLFTYDRNGNDPTCYFSHPGHLVMDPFTYFEKEPKASDLNVQAVCRCEIAVLTEQNFGRIVDKFPDFESLLRKILFEISLEFGNQKALLSLSAPDRYKYFVRQYPEIARKTPLKFIASYLGIAQPSLSRIRKMY